MKRALIAGLFCMVSLLAGFRAAAEPKIELGSPYEKPNLVAWCIVPFDAKARGPAERAAMLERLGIKRVAYDWRNEHVATFEQEILEYKKHGLEYFAFWDWHDAMGPLIRKHGIRPQIWKMLVAPRKGPQESMVEEAARGLLPTVETARKLGCKVGIYNHGGWHGEPANMVAVCQYLRKHHDAKHVGIVYNFHHGHEHIETFAKSFALMRPYLLCLNLNGMTDPPSVDAKGHKKIVPIGSGRHERGMMRIVRESGYRGPIGILDHRTELDAEKSLRQNLDGLHTVLQDLGDKAALKTFGQ